MKRGHLWWREEWYSVCSGNHPKAVIDGDVPCILCQTGKWTNVWVHEISNLIFKLFPKVWIWWVNILINKRRILDIKRRK